MLHKMKGEKFNAILHFRNFGWSRDCKRCVFQHSCMGEEIERMDKKTELLMKGVTVVVNVVKIIVQARGKRKGWR